MAFSIKNAALLVFLFVFAILVYVQLVGNSTDKSDVAFQESGADAQALKADRSSGDALSHTERAGETDSERSPAGNLLFGLSPPSSVRFIKRLARPDGPLSLSFDSLVERANHGDGEAALQLGRSLATCQKLPRSHAEFSERVERAQGRNSSGEAESSLLMNKADIFELQQDYEFCKGITDEQISQYAYWQMHSAELGVLEAQAEFMHQPVDLEVRRKASQMIWESDDGYIVDAARFYQLAANRGSPESMISVAQWALRGLIPEISVNEVSAYFISGLVARDAAGLPTAMFLDRANQLMSNRSDADIREIEAISRRLLDDKNCCIYFE